MLRFALRLVLLAAVLMPLPLCAQTPVPTYDASKFVLFLHSGPWPPDDRVVKLIAGALAQRGFLVRAPDNQKDEIGGPGVDYFDGVALAAANDIAAIVNNALVQLGVNVPDNKKLKPRLQRAKTPPTYLGVWLF
jgi:hypothetical protein